MAKGAGGRGGRLETEEDADGESVCVWGGGGRVERNAIVVKKGGKRVALCCAWEFPFQVIYR